MSDFERATDRSQRDQPASDPATRVTSDVEPADASALGVGMGGSGRDVVARLQRVAGNGAVQRMIESQRGTRAAGVQRLVSPEQMRSLTRQSTMDRIRNVGGFTATDAVAELHHAAWPARRSFRERYDEAYGPGSLSTDVGLVYDGWELTKLRTLLYRPRLTDAQQLYGFVINDHDESAFRLLNRHLDRGTLVTTLWNDWTAHVADRHGYEPNPPNMEYWLYGRLRSQFTEAAEARCRSIFTAARSPADVDDATPDDDHIDGDDAGTDASDQPAAASSVQFDAAAATLATALAPNAGARLGASVMEALDSTTVGRPRAHRLLARAYRRASGGRELLADLKLMPEGPGRPTAIGLYFGGRESDAHVRMAAALLRVGTTDQEVAELVQRSSLAGRQAMRRRYDDVFQRRAGISDGLLADLWNDQWEDGWTRMKTRQLFYVERLSEAQQLFGYAYNDDGDHVVSILERHQRAGTLLTSLWQQWRDTVASSDERRLWAPREISMEYWLYDQLASDYATIARGIFRVARAERATENDADDSRTRLAVRVMASLERLRAAVNGSNDPRQAQAAADTFREAYRSAAAAAESDDERSELAVIWRRQVAIMERAAGGTGGLDDNETEEFRARLRTEPTEADQVYFALRNDDGQGVLDKLDAIWAGQRRAQFRAAADRAHVVGDRVIRPAFLVVLENQDSIAAFGHTNFFAVRINQMAGPGDDVFVGASRIATEIDAGDDPVAKIHTFLRRVGAARARAIVEQFMERPNFARVNVARLGEHPEHLVVGRRPTSIDHFLSTIFSDYEVTRHSEALEDLLAPPTTDAERAQRAGDRHERATSGLAVPFVDAFTMEDTERLSAASARRLEVLASDDGERLRAQYAEFYGVPAGEVGSHEYEIFQRRIDAFRDAQAQAAEIAATIVEIGTELVLTAVTGGAAGVALANSIAAIAAGIAVREAMLGPEYEATSRANAARIVEAVASAGVGALVERLYSASRYAGRLDDMLGSGELATLLDRSDVELVDLMRRLTPADRAAQAALSDIASHTTESWVHGQITGEGRVDQAAVEGAVVRFLGRRTGDLANNAIVGRSDAVLRTFAGRVADECLQTIGDQVASLPQAGSQTTDRLLVDHFLIPLRGAVGSAARGTLNSLAKGIGDRPEDTDAVPDEDDRSPEAPEHVISPRTGDTLAGIGPMRPDARTGDTLAGIGPTRPDARTGDTLAGIGPVGDPALADTIPAGDPALADTIPAVDPARADTIPAAGREPVPPDRAPAAPRPLPAASVLTFEQRRRFEDAGLASDNPTWSPFEYVDDWHRAGGTGLPPPHGFIDANGAPRFWISTMGANGAPAGASFPHGASPAALEMLRQTYRERIEPSLPPGLADDPPTADAITRAYRLIMAAGGS